MNIVMVRTPVEKSDIHGNTPVNRNIFVDAGVTGEMCIYLSDAGLLALGYTVTEVTRILTLLKSFVN